MKVTPRPQQGFALVLTLWVLAALSILLLTFSMQVRTNIRAAGYLRAQAQADQLARSAIERMAVALVDAEAAAADADESAAADRQETVETPADQRLGTWVLETGSWRIVSNPATTPRGGNRGVDTADVIVCEISAEETRLPLDRVWTPIAEDLGLTVENAFALPEGLLALRAHPHPRIDATIDELYPLVTTFSRGQVFVNAAQAEVLRRIPGVDERTAQALAERVRRQGPFTRMSQIGDIVGVTPSAMGSLEDWFTLSARYFRVVPQVAGSRIEAVIDVEGDRARIVHIGRRPTS